MSDMRATWILRTVLVSALWLLAMSAVWVLDAAIGRFCIYIGLPKLENFIECGFFAVAVWNCVWGWAERRVWIGNKAPRS